MEVLEQEFIQVQFSFVFYPLQSWNNDINDFLDLQIIFFEYRRFSMTKPPDQRIFYFTFYFKQNMEIIWR